MAGSPAAGRLEVTRRAERTARHGLVAVLLRGVALAAIVLAAPIPARAQNLDEMSLDRWKQLREVERYQMKIADDYYRQQNWKVALAEYAKFMELYERSEGASYAQLRWSLCQVHLKKVNTAIADGFQTVIDYWPDSAEATAAAYFIGRSYKNMGEVKKAKKAYQDVLKKHPAHLVAVLSAVDTADLAGLEKDVQTQVAMWKSLTFDAKRTPQSRNHCENASRSLAVHFFSLGSVDEAVKAIETTYKPDQVPYRMVELASGQITAQVSDTKTQAKGERLADACIAWIRDRVPTDQSTPEAKQVIRNHWYYMADLHSAARRDGKVLETYAQIEKMHGPDDATLGQLAAFHKTRGKWDDARKAYARFANQVNGQAEIAQSFYQENQFEKAANAYRQVLALDPMNAVKWKPSIAYCFRRAGKTEESVAAYLELVVDDKASPDRWRVEAGHTYREHGKYKEAVGTYRQCEPNASVFHWMASCHRALKEYNEAVTLYNQVIGAWPASAPGAMYEKGRTYEDQGKSDLAIKTLQQVCKQFPKDSHASAAHARLQDVFKVTVTLGGDKTEQ